MSFETASTTTCGQSLLARATATNQLLFVDARIETATRTANDIGSATALPTLTNPVTGAINSVTYSLNQTRVTVRFNNLQTTSDFHTVWLMAKLANDDDSAAVPICAVVSQAPIYIPTTSQSITHIDIHMNLSFVRADGTVSITEGPAWMISDQIQYRNEVRAELDGIEANIDYLQSTVVTISDTQTIYGAKSFNVTTAFNGAVQANSTLNVTGTTTLGTVLAGSTTTGTLNVTGATTLGTVLAGSTTTGTLTTYAITPRTSSTSSTTGYDLGASNDRWKYVYARYGNFSYSVTVDGTVTATTFYGNLSGHLTTAQNIDGMAFDGSVAITHFGTCDTAAATAAKTVSLDDFSLVTGARILVKFTNSNTASSPTLNVNSTGAVRIYLRVNKTAGTTNVTSWEAGDTVEFVYDGSYWRKVNHVTNISGNAATATSATSATIANKLASSSTDYLYYYSSSYGLSSTQRICPSTDKGASLGHSDRYWNYGYIDTIRCSTLTASGNISSSGNISITGTSTLSGGLSLYGGASLSGDIVINNTLYFGSDKTVKMNMYSSGIDVTGHLTPVSGSTYNLGSVSYPWNRLYVNYITGTGVAKSIAGYGSGTAQDSSYPVGSLIFAQITTATNPSGTQLPNSTLASPQYFGDIPASKIRKISLFASGDKGNVTCWQNSNATLLSGTWRCIGDVWSSNVTSYPPVVLVVRIA